MNRATGVDHAPIDRAVIAPVGAPPTVSTGPVAKDDASSGVAPAPPH
jgi:hypothetical protein